MKKDRNISKTGRWIFACAAALFLTQAFPSAGSVRPLEILASGGLQTQEGEAPDGEPSDAKAETQEKLADLLSEDQQALLDELLKKLENGELSTKEQIDEAIGMAQEELGITLSGQQKEQLSALLLEANGLGLDRETLLDGAQALYEKYGSAVMESANDAIRENIVEPAKDAVVEETKKTFREFFRDMGQTVKNFFVGLSG
ncbi:MAG TPA: DUF1002 domain-containing protein [Candidatus Eisenbergiella intestinipullorum]|nr:DUF1002 domain-containing protein [Candidatus Eisenbergiella intestinipullorum]